MVRGKRTSQPYQDGDFDWLIAWLFECEEGVDQVKWRKVVGYFECPMKVLVERGIVRSEDGLGGKTKIRIHPPESLRDACGVSKPTKIPHANRDPDGRHWTTKYIKRI